MGAGKIVGWWSLITKNVIPQCENDPNWATCFTQETSEPQWSGLLNQARCEESFTSYMSLPVHFSINILSQHSSSSHQYWYHLILCWDSFTTSCMTAALTFWSVEPPDPASTHFVSSLNTRNNVLFGQIVDQQLQGASHFQNTAALQS